MRHKTTYKGGFSVSVPADIRAIPKPQNTIVDDSGCEGPKRYAVREEATYLANAKRKNTFSPEKNEVKKNLFGVIVLESYQALEPKVAYICYEDRWLLELVFKRYNSDECLDYTGEQGDFSVIGSEFVNFSSTIATCHIIKKVEHAGLLEQMSPLIHLLMTDTGCTL